jgi:hypothetical protein
MTRAPRRSRHWVGPSIRLFVAPVAVGTAAAILGTYFYLTVSVVAALALEAAALVLWTWFVFVVLRGDVVRTGRSSVHWAIFVYFTGVFGLIAWDFTRRQSS